MLNKFGDNFKQLRKTKGYTQERIAEMLGVSPQAISKWECGSSYPDIVLLPVIANMFQVSTDYLLGVDASRKEDVIKDILEEAERLSEKKRFQEAAGLLEKALSAYPADERIMYLLAWNLTGTIRENPENLQEAIAIYEKILEISRDEELKRKVRRDLLYRYMTAGDEKAARNIAEGLPSFEVCREYNLGRSNLLSGRELAGYLQDNIRLYGEAMKECLEYFLNERILSNEEMKPYSVEKGRELTRLVEQILAE